MAELDTITEFAELLGIDSLDLEEVRRDPRDFFGAAIVGLCDGDFDLEHHSPLEGTEAHLYGEHFDGDGLVAKTAARIAMEDESDEGVVADFQRLAVEGFFSPNGPFFDHSHRIPLAYTRIYPGLVAIEDNPIPLQRSPEMVMDYGSCIDLGRSIIFDQLKFPVKDTFSFLSIARMDFTNMVLGRTYDLLGDRGLGRNAIESRKFIPLSQGISSATSNMLAAYERQGLPSDNMDIIICMNAEHSTPGDVKDGIDRAPALLRDEGFLILGGLIDPPEGKLGVEEMTSWAFEAGFDQRAVRYDQVHTNPNRTARYGTEQYRSMVLSK